jgi:hypothetical protein
MSRLGHESSGYRGKQAAAQSAGQDKAMSRLGHESSGYQAGTQQAHSAGQDKAMSRLGRENLANRFRDTSAPHALSCMASGLILPDLNASIIH